MTPDQQAKLHEVMEIIAKMLRIEYDKGDLRRGGYGARQRRLLR